MSDYREIQQADDRRRGLNMKAVVAGSVLGAGAALLLAPCSGRDLRCKIAEGSSKVGRSVGNRVSHISQDAAGLGSKLRRAVSNVVADVKDSLRAGQNAMRDGDDFRTPGSSNF